MTRTRHCTVTWLGHSAFSVLASDGTSILFDPWLDNPMSPAGAKNTAGADIILVSHGHSDHIGNAPEIAARTNATVVSIFEVSLHLKSLGVSKSVGMNKGGTVKVGSVSVSMVDAKHSSDIDVDGRRIPGGEAAGFVARLSDGYTLYHAGDTSLFGDMALISRLYHPDLAFLPIGDVYTMDPAAAAIACSMLRTSTIIPMHYGTFPALTGTPGELRKRLAVPLKKKLLILEPGVPVEL